MNTFWNKVTAMRKSGRHIGEVNKPRSVESSPEPVKVKPKKSQKRVKKETAVKENDERSSTVIEFGDSANN